jgi:hypothetical protein
MSPRIRCFCLVVTIVGAPYPSRAQEADPPSIPTELVHALLGRGESELGRPPRIFVGRAPDGVPQSLTSLEGGTVLGGTDDGRNTVLIVAFTLPPNQIVLSVDRQLRARGWTPPPPPPGEERGGFISSGYSAPFGNAYCSDSTSLALASVPAPRGGTYLKITQLRNQQFSFCRRRDRERMLFGSQFKFPALMPPAGMATYGGGGGSGGSNTSINTRLTGPLKPSEVLAHYRAQLDAAGWRTRAPVASGDDVAITYVEASDTSHVVWRGFMTVFQADPTSVDVEIKMVNPRGR